MGRTTNWCLYALQIGSTEVRPVEQLRTALQHVVDMIETAKDESLFVYSASVRSARNTQKIYEFRANDQSLRREEFRLMKGPFIIHVRV